MINHEPYIERCLKLAKKGKYQVSPNPMVGAIIVKKGKIIAEGYHKKFGGPHAEIEVFCGAGRCGAGSTLYCNLEPCSHYGKTPPCTNAIIEAKISQVIIGCSDPFKAVNGSGIQILKNAGIQVTEGVHLEKCRELNHIFFHAHQKQRPYVLIKTAASLDAKIALSNGESKWITGVEARTHARKRRDEFQAILVGINTVIHDNPNLGGEKSEPLRVIIDPNLKISPSSQVCRNNNCLIITKKNISRSEKARELQKINISILEISELTPAKILSALYAQNIISLLIEGGSTTIEHFLNTGLCDEIDYYLEPVLIGKTGISALPFQEISKLKDAPRIQNCRQKKLGDSYLFNGRIIFPKFSH